MAPIAIFGRMWFSIVEEERERARDKTFQQLPPFSFHTHTHTHARHAHTHTALAAATVGTQFN